MQVFAHEKEDALGKISRETFIRLSAALGVGAASASLAACGGGSDSGSSGGSGNGSGGGSGGAASTPAASSPASGETTMMSDETTMMSGSSSGGSAIAQESEVAPGSAVKFKDGGKDAVLIHLDDGDFVAYSAVCTHAGCTVAYKNAQLACPCHGSIFDPANGAEVVSGPAQTPLPEIPIEVQNGEIVKA
jgi:cytochrome b6-f complex iron-sulfur subunit